ncbi:metalloregulator ArsR/SmtB family transcription factor [Dactylosporangium sp. NPDC051485]|uniref:metalloregulator ArsR/SmtB family transcription factor n=1 Tax=Dactylosporangium sp. NPDC051485 TaxID=3154846 RepID=UPI00343061F7
MDVQDNRSTGARRPAAEHVAAAAETLRLLTDHTRLTLLHALAQGDAERNELTAHVGLEAAIVSQQLSRLRLARLITSYKADGRVVYSLPDPHLRRMVSEMLAFAERSAAEAG